MRKPRIEKVVVHVCVGKKKPLELVMKLLEKITGQKPVIRKAKKTIEEFKIKEGDPIACMVTLRKQKAKEFLKKAFQAIDNKLPSSSFNPLGKFSFGIESYIDIPGVKYDPELGIIGMDVCVDVCRPGMRVKNRRRARRPVGAKQYLTKEESIEFIKEEFGIKILESQ